MEFSSKIIEYVLRQSLVEHLSESRVVGRGGLTLAETPTNNYRLGQSH